MSLESEHSDSSSSAIMIDDTFLHNEASRPLTERVVCTICRLQMSTATYFNVSVCLGCKSFFRRSVKNGKKYHCLNSRLCGKNQCVYFNNNYCLVVPNRRVCKFCRFNRCVKAGMLDAKVKLQSRLMESVKVQLNNPTSSSPPLPLVQLSNESSGEMVVHRDVIPVQAPIALSCTPIEFPSSSSFSNVLIQFGRLRRQIRAERLRLYGPELETPKISTGALHDMQVGLNEYNMFNKIVGSTENLFSEIDVDDWHALNIQEYSLWYSICEQTMTTIRNRGHEIRRIYNTDGSYTPLNSDHTRKHWSFIYSSIYGNRDAIFDATMDYMFHVQLIMCSTVGTQLAKAKLDDAELSALLLLLMTRPACMEIVQKRKTRQFLHTLRDQVLASLAVHIGATGRMNVDERMAQIIFLITDLQNLGRLIQHSMRLLMSATDYRALPDHFFQALEQSPPILIDPMPCRRMIEF